MDEKKTPAIKLLWLIPLVAATVYILACREKVMPYQTIRGTVFGTLYTITYQSMENVQPEVEEELRRFDYSLSPFNESSVISKVNRNEEVETDTLFQNVFNRAMQISEETEGAFDITVASLVNVWGFGFKKGDWPDQHVIDSLLEITGYQKIKLNNGKVIKEDPRVMISCSAVAKGYATDVIARYLSGKGIKNYMVDIGGEIVVKGENPTKQPWRIGINKPVEDSLAINQELQLVLRITDIGLATSGNYRNYYYKDGKKYGHTIDPKTGYPVQHEILSATVIAADCMSADAYATAFMVMGLEKAVAFADNHPTIGACFIYNDEEGRLSTYLTENIKKYISDNPEL